MSFWDWALESYERPGVAHACLTLQDDYGQNTSFLLWAVWSGSDSLRAYRAAADLARRWDAATLHPIRAARRALKPPMPPIDGPKKDQLRDRVKAVELEAERLLMETLEAEFGLDPFTSPSIEQLRDAVAVWGVAAPEAALQALIDALTGPGA